MEALRERLSVFSLHHPPVVVSHGILREVVAPVAYVDDTAAGASEADVARIARGLRKRFAISAENSRRFLPRKYVRLAAALAALARAQGLTHLHAHFASRAAHVALLAAALTDCRFSMTAHAKDIYHSDVDVEVLRWKIANSSFVVTVTDYNARYLRDLVSDVSGADQKIVRIYNGVELSRFVTASSVRSELPLFLSIGRLVEKKGFPILIDACRILADRGYRFACEIIGDGEQQQALRAGIEMLRLKDTVRLSGSMTTEEVARRLSGCFAMVLACVRSRDGNVDALPTVLLEAMASERPVISTRISGVPEIVVDGQTGLLVSPNDPRALADSMAVLLDEPDRARDMGHAGRVRAQELFDLYANANAIRTLIREHAVRAVE